MIDTPSSLSGIVTKRQHLPRRSRSRARTKRPTQDSTKQQTEDQARRRLSPILCVGDASEQAACGCTRDNTAKHSRCVWCEVKPRNLLLPEHLKL